MIDEIDELPTLSIPNFAMNFDNKKNVVSDYIIHDENNKISSKPFSFKSFDFDFSEEDSSRSLQNESEMCVYQQITPESETGTNFSFNDSHTINQDSIEPTNNYIQVMETTITDEKVDEKLKQYLEINQKIQEEIIAFEKAENFASEERSFLSQEYDRCIEEAKTLQVRICQLRHEVLTMANPTTLHKLQLLVAEIGSISAKCQPQQLKNCD